MSSARNTVEFAGYTLGLAGGHLEVERAAIRATPADYGADPLGDGRFRMVPSGDVVSWEERCRRLPVRK